MTANPDNDCDSTWSEPMKPNYMLFDPSAPLASDAPTAIAVGTLTLTLEQARRVLGHLGHLDLDPVHEGTTWTSLLFNAFAANLAAHQNEPADVEFPRPHYGPILVFTGGSVEWQSSFTRGRTVTLGPAATGGVRMTWFSGTSKRSRLIGCILRAIDRQPFTPTRREKSRLDGGV